MDDREGGQSEAAFAIAGKVLVANEFHIQTIESALRPAWGNPRGLKFQPHGNNIFVATLESKRDVDRIWEGAPWMVGFHAVILENFDRCMRPREVVFGRLPIWVRCYDLPFNWLNKERAEFVASQIGEFIKLDQGGTNRGWGQSLRAKVWIDINKPLRRVLSFNSLKRGKIDTYEVQYERLPYFCFACGVLGHSDTFCNNPLPRKEDGSWEYDSSIRFLEIKKKKPQPTPVMKQDPVAKPPKIVVKPTWQAKTGNEQGGRAKGGPILNANTGQVKQAVFKFDAQTSGNYVVKPKAQRSLDLSGLPGDEAALALLQANEENQGTKRTAVLNSPSKVGEVRDPKKTKTDGELSGDDDEMAAAEDQPRREQ